MKSTSEAGVELARTENEIKGMEREAILDKDIVLRRLAKKQDI